MGFERGGRGGGRGGAAARGGRGGARGGRGGRKSPMCYLLLVYSGFDPKMLLVLSICRYRGSDYEQSFAARPALRR